LPPLTPNAMPLRRSRSKPKTGKDVAARRGSLRRDLRFAVCGW
jgi:hypothetical protein